MKQNKLRSLVVVVGAFGFSFIPSAFSADVNLSNITNPGGGNVGNIINMNQITPPAPTTIAAAPTGSGAVEGAGASGNGESGSGATGGDTGGRGTSSSPSGTKGNGASKSKSSHHNDDNQ